MKIFRFRVLIDTGEEDVFRDIFKVPKISLITAKDYCTVYNFMKDNYPNLTYERLSICYYFFESSDDNIYEIFKDDVITSKNTRELLKKCIFVNNIYKHIKHYYYISIWSPSCQDTTNNDEVKSFADYFKFVKDILSKYNLTRIDFYKLCMKLI